MHVTLYGRSFIIINSARAAFEMLDKKGALYSDRAKRAMLELSDLDMDIPQAPYGDRHRKLRTMILKSLGTRATVTSFADVFDTHWNRFLRRVVESTDTSRHLLSFIRRYVSHSKRSAVCLTGLSLGVLGPLSSILIMAMRLWKEPIQCSRRPRKWC